MKVHLKMLGCRLNQAEIDALARQFEQQGHRIVDSSEEADQVIINTCAVTNDAVKSGRKLINDVHRNNATAEITVTGCHAQIAPQDIATLGGVARVVGNRDKHTIVEQITGQASEPYEIEPIERDKKGFSWRTRAFVKVQDGCDNACTFCVTTVARGEGLSRPMAEVVHEVRYLHSIGYQETVLTGVHLGSYGHDFGDKNGLMTLVQRLLEETDIPRLRLSSLEPWDLSDNFFSLWQNPRLCPHLHLPLQSGCDTTLKRMRRNTTTPEFRDLVQSARAQIPFVRITSDVIVGFPQETDAEFEASEAFIHEMQFDGLHVFRYSTRAGTPASKMRGHVPNDIKKIRSQRLIQHATEREIAFAQALQGVTVNILWENILGSTPEGFVNVGYSENYQRVQAIHPRVLTNHITPATIAHTDNGITWSTPLIDVIE